MAITRATVAQARALWAELSPMWEEDLANIHRALEQALDWPTVRALQARAIAVQAFLKVPQHLDTKLTLAEQQQTADKETH